ncbi:S-layer homology domain-containing protein [Geosporobacter subterraneus DSM 17957]|uniref:S-layer homology domain-containing protein n=1 Tax=Geosporobacter subterraneus DSM 17957 TaxID=1121919 RepID=A0A1M6QQM0_9FIRM|nr:S-layer homology domain-containing protein [Geosporobacter subterraneus]SHK22579.1 S-layer homology domain-containing protein [Geosporobacter subterraneus DSM 17957]
MKHKRVLALMIVSILLMSTAVSFGATVFSDVASNHWAKDHIAKMSEKGIIRGFEDSITLRFNFKPDNPVTYVESIQMIYQTLKAANRLKSTIGIATKHTAVLNSAKIPTWAHEAMSYALEYNIIHQDELKNFVKNNIQANAKRVDVAVFLGKAIDMDDAIDPLPILGFVDSEMIIRAAVPYVDLLVKKGIISGDTNNKFNPGNPIRRAEMATICSKAFDLLDSGEKTVVEPQTPVKNDKENVRFIEHILASDNMLVVKDELGNQEVLRLNGVIIKVNGVTSRIGSLYVNQKIKLIYDKDNKLDTVEADNSVKEFIGIVDKITTYTDYVALTVVDENNSNNTRVFKAYNTLGIQINGVNSSAKNLKIGDMISINADGDKATNIVLMPNNREFDGILESEVYFKDTPMIKVRVRGEVLELAVNDNVYVTRNGRTRGTDGKILDVDSLVKGDIVTITLKNNKVIEIIATSLTTKKDDSGTIKSYTIGNPSQITIVGSGNLETSYNVSSTATITVDGKSATLYDLRPNYAVELKIESNSVVSIKAESIQAKDRFTGEIVKVYTNHSIVTVKYLDRSNNQYTTRPVSVNADTVILDTDGKSIAMSRLAEKSEIFVDGFLEDEFFIAEKIIVLKK